MKVSRVNSFQDILLSIKDIKDLKQGLVTNYFPEPVRIQYWIESGLLELVRGNNTFFLIKKQANFRHISFFSTDVDRLKKDLVVLFDLYPGLMLVVDIVGLKKDIDSLQKLFCELDFSIYTSLNRMSRLKSIEIENYIQSPFVHFADDTEALDVFNLLNLHFDPLSEQIPLQQEIIDFAKKDQIIVYRQENEEIKGFIIFELTKTTSYWRYWFVDPIHRNKKIGSAMMSSYLYLSRETKRQLLWVIESNENAKNRQMHYGFSPEMLYDYVMINNNKYEK